MATCKLKTVMSVLGLTFLAAAGSPAQQLDRYRVIRTVPLGGEDSWDYLRFDSDSGRLFVARSTRVMVVDAHAGRVLGEVPHTAGVHGVALVTDLHRGVTGNGKANTATIFNLETLKPLASVATGEKPDAILWDPFSKTVLTMNGHSDSITVIDPGSAQAVATISLPGRPETAVSDHHGKICKS
jgi:YVTN family beta-propeller protein